VTSALLQVKDIHTYYGEAHILDGVSFDVPKRSCVGILGRNQAPCDAAQVRLPPPERVLNLNLVPQSKTVNPA